MSFLGPKVDRYGQQLTPGDVCARSINDKVELVIYKGVSWGGPKSKGEFGQFITKNGKTSIKLTNVAFVFDPMSYRRAKSEDITNIIRQYYEGK